LLNHYILDRVDEIPTALVLIQAANESAWGNSRFARQANNYFGQWRFTKGCGLVPLRRNAGAKHEVQYFTSAELSVRAYIHNLNTSPSYKMLRNLRHFLRRQGKPLDAEFLAIGLKDYSERGMDYVRIIQGMIRSNKALIQAL
jgi:Bax protein